MPSFRPHRVHGFGPTAITNCSAAPVILGFATVVVLGALFGGFAVPAGLLLGLNPIVTYLAACLGAGAVIWPLLIGGGALRDRLVDRVGRGRQAGGWTRRLVERHGPLGLGMVGPVFPGVTASCSAGLALGVEVRSLARWMSLGTAILYAAYTTFWSLVLDVG